MESEAETSPQPEPPAPNHVNGESMPFQKQLGFIRRDARKERRRSAVRDSVGLKTVWISSNISESSTNSSDKHQEQNMPRVANKHTVIAGDTRHAHLLINTSSIAEKFCKMQTN